MKRKTIYTVIVACATLLSHNSVSAQEICADAIGRAEQMYLLENYTGAINELQLLPESKRGEAADRIKALSLVKMQREEAENAVKSFIARYPESLHVTEMEMALAELYFFKGDYVAALDAYNQVPAQALNGEMLADKNYRTGFCMIHQGDYTEALPYFKAAAKHKKYSGALTFYQAYILYAEKDYSGASQLFTKINSNSELGRQSEYYLAQIYYHNEDYSRALSLSKKLLGEDIPAIYRPEMTRIAGECEYYSGNSDEAAEMLRQYYDLCSQMHMHEMRSAWYVSGLIARENNDTEGTIEYMSKVTDITDAMTQSAYLYLGQAYAKLKNYSAASMAFEKSMNMDYDEQVQETAYFNYAVAQSKGARTPFGSAITNFEKFLNRYPNSAYTEQVEEFLIDAYIHGNDYLKAYESIGRIHNPSEEVIRAKQYVAYNLGINAANCNDDKEAIKYLTESVEIGNKGNNVWQSALLWLGDCQYREGNYAAAGTAYAQYIKAVNQRDGHYYTAYYNLAYTRYQQRKYSVARTDFLKATGKKSNLDNRIRADAMARIGDTYYYEKNYAAASQAYNKAIEADAENGDYATLRLAIVTGLQRRHSDKIAILNKLLARYPNSPLCATAMLEKAEAETSIGNTAAAVTTFESLLGKYPSGPEARKAQLRLAITHKSNGNENDAIENYKKVVRLYPSSEEAALAVEDLKMLYAERGDLESLENYLTSIPNAPKIEANELDRLEFAAAERAYIGEKGDISRMNSYIAKYPKGEHRTNALYYIATEEYNTGNYDSALEHINEVLRVAADASFAENALAMKGNILAMSGRHAEAFEAFTALLSKSSTADHRTRARLGIMRSGYKLRKYAETVSSAT
ncbi:MAG: tetratricopeptide repeat protein, partial [Muribaculaceae bacterium]|nr:tetratricopeptide repeat protein [Muribaculaceae bacterium]